MNYDKFIRKTLNFSFLFSLLFFTKTYAKTDSLKIADRVGIGVTIEKSLGIRFDRYATSVVGISRVYIPMTFGAKFKVEPEFAYWHYSRSMGNEKYSYSNFHYGFGIFYLYRVGNTIFYIGPRFAVDHIILPHYNSDEDKKSKNDYNYGITIGGEYFFSNNFSLGAEIQMLYIFLGKVGDYDDDENVITNEALVVLRFYF